MEIYEIKQILERNKKSFFGPGKLSEGETSELLGQYYIVSDSISRTITFTSDSLEYTMSNKLEEALERLFTEFKIVDYHIQFHVHEGELHDKDIILSLKEIDRDKGYEEMARIIKFVQDNFYKDCVEWAYIVK